MLHSIGRKEKDTPKDLVSALTDCHAKIRSFIDLAINIGERSDTPTQEVIDACSRVERYFVEAFPRHVRDEEDSILPRLRAKSADVDAVLGIMEREHATHLDPVAKLLETLAAVKADPTSHAQLTAVARELRTDLHEHLTREEAIVFPAINELLTEADREAIQVEMRERRSKPE